MLTQINQWWYSLEQRERQLLKLLAGFIVVVLFYLLLWSPLQSAKMNAQLKMEKAQQEWLWLNEQIPLIQQSKATGTVEQTKIENQNQLLGLVQSSLRKQNLFKDIKTVKGISKGGEVTFDEVSASRLFRWLGSLEQQGLVADKLQMSWLADDKVKARVQFKLAS